jgi:hypothetical protein
MAIDFMEEFESKLEYPGMDIEEVDNHMLEMLGNLDNPESIYLIAYDGKKPAGFFVGWVGNKPYSKPRRVGVAQELYVVPEKRSGIVGMRLMEEAGRMAIERGAQGFECIGTYNGSDQRWAKFGFKPYVTYGHMNTGDFMALVQRFSGGKAA